MSCGLLVVLWSTLRGSVGLLLSLGPALLGSGLPGVPMELGSGLRVLPSILGIELLGLSSVKLITLLRLGLLGVFDLLGVLFWPVFWEETLLMRQWGLMTWSL